MFPTAGSDRYSKEHPGVALGVIGERHVPEHDMCSPGVEISLSVHGANAVCLAKSVEYVVDVIAELLITPPDPAGDVELEGDLVRHHGEPG